MGKMRKSTDIGADVILFPHDMFQQCYSVQIPTGDNRNALIRFNSNLSINYVLRALYWIITKPLVLRMHPIWRGFHSPSARLLTTALDHSPQGIPCYDSFSLLPPVDVHPKSRRRFSSVVSRLMSGIRTPQSRSFPLSCKKSEFVSLGQAKKTDILTSSLSFWNGVHSNESTASVRKFFFDGKCNCTREKGEYNQNACLHLLIKIFCWLEEAGGGAVKESPVSRALCDLYVLKAGLPRD
jgi:hypothetical protein